MKKIADPERSLAAGLEQLQLDPSLSDSLQIYLDELGKWNRTYNLTSIRDPMQMVTRHLLDSLSMLATLDELDLRAPLLDVGSGAGLPGLILAIARPALAVHVVDSNGKKARFLRHIQRRLELENVEVFECRVEEMESGSAYGAVTSRAFSSLAQFFDATRHLISVDGHWLAMKGRVNDNELSEIPSTVCVQRLVRLHVPGLSEERHLVLASPSP